MANAINIPKSHLIMGLTLPLAVLLGYFVAEPMDLGSLAVVVFVLVLLAIPLLMKWYYPLLVLSWNAAFWLAFLPGRPHLWVVMAYVGLLFAVINRAVSADAQFVNEPSITRPLLVLTGVVVATALMNGGFGIKALGSSQYGGRRYIYFLAAVAGYFLFTSRRIPPHRAGLYVALFFLSALTYGLSDLAVPTGSAVKFLWLFVVPGGGLEAGSPAAPGAFFAPLHRLADLSFLGAGLYSYLLVRFGVRGLLDWARPWRLLLLFAAVGAGLASGFRSFLLQVVITSAFVFCLEGLHRTRYLPALLGVFLLGSAVVLPQADKLPLVAQRALSFLPGRFDFAAKLDADSSTEWRVVMWKQLLPEVPRYLLRGKGWGIDAREFTETLNVRNNSEPLAGVIMAGDFHNGPLSLLIQLGIYGAVAFIWFLVAGLRVLHRNWKFGSPALRSVNALLLAAFATRTVFFFFFFGSLHSDMMIFTGWLGLSVALNGAEASPQAEPAVAGVEFSTEYIKV